MSDVVAFDEVPGDEAYGADDERGDDSRRGPGIGLTAFEEADDEEGDGGDEDEVAEPVVS